MEVIDGGSNGIEIQIIDPEGKIIHEDEEQSAIRLTFRSSIEDTMYTYCFINQKDGQNLKKIMFTMNAHAKESEIMPNESNIN